MEPRVGIVGVGWTGFSPATGGISYKELMFEAARQAYADAGLHPRTGVDSFVCASEDMDEGTSIFDEYVPDQLGAVQRPVHTVASDGLFALVTGVMLIRSGIARIVAIEAHAKSSDVMTPDRISRFAMDPILNRPIGVPPTAIAALEMRRYLHERGIPAEACAEVAATSREKARTNPRASFADVADPTPTWDPLTREQEAERADGAIVLVLAHADHAHGKAIWVDGVGWDQDAPSLESREWGRAAYAARAAGRAYAQAGATPNDVDLAEVDDTFAYKQIQHLDALGLSGLAPSYVNPSGGALGEGHVGEATGLARVLSCVERLRAGEGRVAIALSWRGVPSSSGAAAVMSLG